MVYMPNYVLSSRWDKIGWNRFSASCYISCYIFYVLAFHGPKLVIGIAMGLQTSTLYFKRSNSANYSPSYAKVPFCKWNVIFSLDLTTLEIVSSTQIIFLFFSDSYVLPVVFSDRWDFTADKNNSELQDYAWHKPQCQLLSSGLKYAIFQIGNSTLGDRNLIFISLGDLSGTGGGR